MYLAQLNPENHDLRMEVLTHPELFEATSSTTIAKRASKHCFRSLGTIMQSSGRVSNATQKKKKAVWMV